MAKEKSLAELRAEKAEAIKRAKELTDNARKEERKLTDDEMKDHTEISTRLAELNIEIAAHEERNKGDGAPYVPSAKKPFSLRRAIVAQMNGHEQRDSEAEAIDEAIKAHRSISGQF